MVTSFQHSAASSWSDGFQHKADLTTKFSLLHRATSMKYMLVLLRRRTFGKCDGVEKENGIEVGSKRLTAQLRSGINVTGVFCLQSMQNHGLILLKLIFFSNSALCHKWQ